jgi:precorrin-2/cobalt-factor-2 C20-methyltransferase
MSGTLYGVGVGPGDPELVTLKALRIAKACPVLAYPMPERGASLARAIMAEHLPGGQIELPIGMELAREPTATRANYDRAAEAIVAHLDAGRDVAALCLGDPLFYGSFIYLFARVAERHPIAVVPGVTSLAAASAALGNGLVAGDDSLAVIPATQPDAAIRARLAHVEAAAIVKLGRHFARVRRIIEEAGLGAHARYVEAASLPNQRVLPLAEVDAASASYFSLVIVRKHGEAWR